MLGVYLTAAELAKRGFIVSPTSRSAFGADLLVTDQQCKRAWSVQVKTNAKKAGFWLCGIKACELKSPSHVYVFVNAQIDAPKGKEPVFFIVPSSVVSKKLMVERSKTGSVWYAFYRDEAHRDRWRQVFGRPHGPEAAKPAAQKIAPHAQS
jgi:hypothetical protein